MKQIYRSALVLIVAALTATAMQAQTTKWRDMHKVKKKETIFGIAKEYGITVDELKKANPEMNNPNYVLKKGDFIFIPYAQPVQETAPAVKPVKEIVLDDVRYRSVRLGVMLPLHDMNGDGRRMVEYYRGVLMACDSLKREGISVDVHAWNTVEGGDLNAVLTDPAAQKCDLIIGPLYSAQLLELSRFVEKYNIKLVIPFSINAPQLQTNRNIYQIYQSPTAQNDAAVAQFVERFKNYHPVVIDCNDSTSRKGLFTTALRRQLEAKNIDYSISNLKSSDGMFKKAFSADKPNVVVLNTGRAQELGMAFAKLNSLRATSPEFAISMFGYTEWLGYTKLHLENFYRFNTYIPSAFYMNPLASATARFQNKYRQNFQQEMINMLPRLAITGFDHAYYFCKGLHKQGKEFVGTLSVLDVNPLQTPLRFERQGEGGMQNRMQMLVHYMPEHRVEILK